LGEKKDELQLLSSEAGFTMLITSNPSGHRAKTIVDAKTRKTLIAATVV
jgi:hypothetical protein